MSFTIDKQTLNDLNIFGKHGHNSLFSLFCRTHTRGGAALLEEMFRHPLGNAEDINKRTEKIQFFQHIQVKFPYGGDLFNSADYYLSNTDSRTKLSLQTNTLNRKFRNVIGAENQYELLHKGVLSMITIINISKDFICQLKATSTYECCREDIEALDKILEESNTSWAAKEKGKKRLTYEKTANYDQILRYEENTSMRELLERIFYLDVYISVGEVARTYNFVFAKAVEKEDTMIQISGLYHPQIEKPVSNDMRITETANMVFLTGANMAGKSTFMKALGIAIFLAHLGFPIPANSMKFSVLDGLCTTINLPDSLNMGYSHFYAEVLRVKKVARNIAEDKKYFVIFDELFRGTNVKDAYDATVAISEAFSQRKKSTFIISTHIIEAAEVLQQQCKNIQFLYLPTTMKEEKPVYTYKLQEGVTADRHGMLIIQNEGILEILNV